MHEETPEPRFLLLFRGNWDAGLPVEQVRTIMDECSAWFQNLQSTGAIVDAQALSEKGTLVTASATHADGPFPESKEIVGGYSIIKATSLEHAVAIARSSPAIPHGVTVEVRPMASICPVQQRTERTLTSNAS